MKITRRQLKRLIKEELCIVLETAGESKEENDAEIEYWKSLFQDLYDDGGKSYPALDPGTTKEDLGIWALQFADNEITMEQIASKEVTAQDLSVTNRAHTPDWKYLSPTNAKAIVDFITRLEQGKSMIDMLGSQESAYFGDALPWWKQLEDVRSQIRQLEGTGKLTTQGTGWITEDVINQLLHNAKKK